MVAAALCCQGIGRSIAATEGGQGSAEHQEKVVEEPGECLGVHLVWLR